MTLTEFLLARIAEEEAKAEAWQHALSPEGDDGFYACPAARTEPMGDLAWGEENCDCRLVERKRRALAECDAKRRIVERCVFTMQAWDDREAGRESAFPDVTRREHRHATVTIADLALPYADHPDYREEWRP